MVIRRRASPIRTIAWQRRWGRGRHLKGTGSHYRGARLNEGMCRPDRAHSEFNPLVKWYGTVRTDDMTLRVERA